MDTTALAAEFTPQLHLGNVQCYLSGSEDIGDSTEGDNTT